VTYAYLDHLYGPRVQGRWTLQHHGGAYQLQVVAAWTQRPAQRAQLWLAVGGVREGGGYRYEPGLLQLLVLGFDEQGRVQERARSPWIRAGDNGGPPHVHGLLKVGADRHAFVTSVSAAHQGYGVTVYELRAPKGPGFQFLGTIHHHDYQGHQEPVWSEVLALSSVAPADASTCWPLRAERTRFVRTVPPTEQRVPDRVLACSRHGTYGMVRLP
jgi:hypothetical protein